MKKEYILALTTVVLWGTLAATVKLLLTDLAQTEVLFLISILATAFLFVVNLIMGNLKLLATYSLKDWGVLIFFSVLGTFLYNAFYNYGIGELTSQEACIINYLWPIMIVIFSAFILKEGFSVRKIVAIIMSFFGIVVVVTRLDFSTLRLESVSGVLACLAAAVCYGLFSTLNKKRAFNQYMALMIYYGVSAILSGIWMAARHDFTPLHGATSIIGILWLGIVGNGLAYLFYSLALLNGNTAKISNIAYITPFMALIFSRILLKEAISIYAVLGLVLIIAGILLQLKDGRKPA